MEIGALAALILPSNIPGSNEFFPAFGPHLAFKTSFAVIETEAMFGIKEDKGAAEVSGIQAMNTVLFVPIGFRFPFESKTVPGYASVGAHAMYYNTHDDQGGSMFGADGGVNFGGGLIFENPKVDLRVDFRVLFRPGTTVNLAFIAFFNV
jgi:hypothetical protein